MTIERAGYLKNGSDFCNKEEFLQKKEREKIHGGSTLIQCFASLCRKWINFQCLLPSNGSEANTSRWDLMVLEKKTFCNLSKIYNHKTGQRGQFKEWQLP